MIEECMKKHLSKKNQKLTIMVSLKFLIKNNIDANYIFTLLWPCFIEDLVFTHDTSSTQKYSVSSNVFTENETL